MLINAGSVIIQTHWMVASRLLGEVLTITYIANDNTHKYITFMGEEALALHKSLIEEAERDSKNSKANTKNWKLQLAKVQNDLDSQEAMHSLLSKKD